MTVMHGCPYLRQVDTAEQARTAESPGACCTALSHADVPGGAYQAALCLTERHRQCPRLPAVGAAPAWIAGGFPVVRSGSTLRLDYPALKFTEVVPLPRVRRARQRRRPRPAALMSLILGILPLLVLLLIAIVYRPQIGRALESTPLLAHSTSPAAQRSERIMASSPTTEHRIVKGASASPTPAMTNPPSPEPTLTVAATSTPTASPSPTLEPSPTTPPATATSVPTDTPISVPTDTPIPVPTGSPPTRLLVPSINLDTPVLPVGPVTVKRGGKEMYVWDTLRDVASFHETSAYPGTGGNIVINGHRDIYGSVFLHLNKIRRGDRITLYAGDLPYLYRVVKVVKLPYVNATPKQIADHLRLLGETREERLTLLTCTPVGTATHRLYVIAEPLSPGRGDLILR